MGEDVRQKVVEVCKAAKAAQPGLARMSSAERADLIVQMAWAIRDERQNILETNLLDTGAPGVVPAMRDRLTLSFQRLEELGRALEEIAGLPEPLGEIIEGRTLANGLELQQVRVPLGVVGVIYESRPSVTVDVAALAIRSGNSVVLRGGSDALHSNRLLAKVIAVGDVPEGAIGFIDDGSRESAEALMQCREYVDVLIPRGGAGLIRSVAQNSRIPVIETGVGNCHIYVDAGADLEMATSIVVNAKTDRPSVCNAAEHLLVHAAVAGEFLPKVAAALRAEKVELRGDEAARGIVPDLVPATEEDWGKEYLDLIMGIKVVADLDAAIAHINTHGSHHSDAIVTADYGSSQRFIRDVDSAAVYVNASTRFTDGGEFGLGAEVGISTQKLHVRGPMGLRHLTTTKWIVRGNGQIRVTRQG